MPIHSAPPPSLLIIEDSEEDRHYYQRLLKQKQEPSFRILEVETGEEGIDVCRQVKPDCILIDYRLPDMDGLELLRLLNEQFQQSVPIIVLTGQGNEQVASQAIKEGASDYLVKGELSQHTFQRAIAAAIKQKQASLDTDRKLKRLVAFLERNPNPIIEMNRDCQLTYMNAAATRLFPDLRQTGTAHPLLDDTLCLWEDLNSLEGNSLIREIRIGDTVYQAEFSLIPEHELIGVYVSDITERKRLEEVRARLVSTVSHELRTPLAVILGCMSNLQDKIAGEMTGDQLELVEIAYKNAERLSRLINNILDLSRLESGRSKIHKEPLNLAQILDEQKNSFLQLTETKGIRFEAHFDPELPKVMADSDMISRVFTNLLSNASRYANSLIRVSARLEPALDEASQMHRWVRVTVHDDGPGIEPKKLHIIFDKFIQVNRSREESGYKGTGLGLAISKEIIEQHGGQIWAESGPGKGSDFHFTLPAARP